MFFHKIFKKNISLTREAIDELKASFEIEGLSQAEPICMSVSTKIFILKIAEYLSTKDYIEVLSLRQKQLLYVDEYGDVREENWHNEVSNFLERKSDDMLHYYYKSLKKEQIDIIKNIIPLIGEGKINNFIVPEYILSVNDKETYLQKILPQSIITIVSAYKEFKIDAGLSSMPNADEIINPYEYEKEIAAIFRNFGWDARETKKSNDQGADVIAVKEGIKLVIQCKLYNGAVGNAAIQEVLGAKNYYDADCAAVVTNSSFTKSAKQLAHSARVILLHDAHIGKFNEKFDLDLKFVLRKTDSASSH